MGIVAAQRSRLKWPNSLRRQLLQQRLGFLQIARIKSLREPSNLKVALKEIEALVRDPRHLQTGKPFEKFGGMRPRDMLANWLLCATFGAIEGRQLVVYSDPIGCDGLIRDELTEKIWQTEHVYVSRHSGGAGADAHALVHVRLPQSARLVA
jgi:hypothetical protein